MRVLLNRNRRIGNAIGMFGTIVAVIGAMISLIAYEGKLWHGLFYFASVALFLCYAFWHLSKKRILTAMTLVPQSFVMLVGVCLLEEPYLPYLVRFPPELMTEAISSKFLACLILYSAILIAMTRNSESIDWPNFDNFRSLYHIDNKHALIAFTAFLKVPGTFLSLSWHSGVAESSGMPTAIIPASLSSNATL